MPDFVGNVPPWRSVSGFSIRSANMYLGDEYDIKGENKTGNKVIYSVYLEERYHEKQSKNDISVFRDTRQGVGLLPHLNSKYGFGISDLINNGTNKWIVNYMTVLEYQEYLTIKADEIRKAQVSV